MKCSRKGTFQRLCRWEMPRSGMIVAVATRISAAGGRKAAKRRTDSRFAKPRIFIARAACCPDMGLLSMQWKVPERERFYVLFASAKRTKKQPGLRPATSVQSSTQACFYRTCSGSCLKRLLGFEPVRKGYHSTSAKSGFLSLQTVCKRAVHYQQ